MYGAQRESERLSARLVATCADLSDANRRGRHRPVGTSRSSIVKFGAEARSKTYSNTRFSTPTAKELYSSLTSLPPTKHHTRRGVSRGIKTVSKQGCDPAPMHHAAHFIFVPPPPLALSISIVLTLTLSFSQVLIYEHLNLGPTPVKSLSRCSCPRERKRRKSPVSTLTTHH